jgi:hypothetical protein
MKTERKRTELSAATFVFIFLCGSRNEYGNTGNKYENRYFRKQIWNEYGADADEKQMIIGTKGVFGWCHQVECNGTVPQLVLVLVFG